MAPLLRGQGALILAVGILFTALPLAHAQTTNWLQSKPPTDRYWTATLGGEWDFMSDKGPPLNGKDWQEVHYGIGYTDKSRYGLTFTHQILARTDQIDQIFGLEGNVKVVGPLWFRGYMAGSPDHDFAYRLRADAEVEAYFRYVSFGAGYWFVNYNTTDIHAITPFVRLYWRDLRFDVRYLNLLDTTADRRFNAVALRAENQFDNRWLRPFVGAVIGSRLFGILTLQESPGQAGFIVYGGDRFGVTPRLDCTVTLSYARENPAFEYVGLGTEMSLKF